MADNERDIVYSESVKAGKRIYYLDVKETRSGDKFITITESKKLEGENAQFIFQKHKIFLYKEDYDKFTTALTRTIAVAKGTAPADLPDMEERAAHEPNAQTDTTINIDMEF